MCSSRLAFVPAIFCVAGLLPGDPAGWALAQALPQFPPGYAGTQACGACHTKQAQEWNRSPMYRALQPPQKVDNFVKYPDMKFQEGPYFSRIQRHGGQVIYSVTDGKDTISVPIKYAFGQGTAGQTYVLEIEGRLYESRLSFYRGIQALDRTMGAQDIKPSNLLEAAGRLMDARDIRECFGCHTLGSFRDGRISLDSMIPGIQCESCHGPAAAHVDGFRSGKPVKMAKLGAMSAEEMGNFCGQCHRTWDHVATNGPRGILNVRFQPYRLVNSKCYDTSDQRISCVACHNPHDQVNRDSASYDLKCAACHSSAPAAKARLCPVGKEKCVSCHMPKYEPPFAHFQFSDHQIRIHRKDEAYPN